MKSDAPNVLKCNREGWLRNVIGEEMFRNKVPDTDGNSAGEISYSVFREIYRFQI